eukprot:Colp12_sorted_trinity150504_noHs@35342
MSLATLKKDSTPVLVHKDSSKIKQIDEVSFNFSAPAIGSPLNTWAECPNYPGYGINKHTTVAHGEKVYIFGGDDGHKMLNDLVRYNVEQKTWSKVYTSGTAPAPRYHHSLWLLLILTAWPRALHWRA